MGQTTPTLEVVKKRCTIGSVVLNPSQYVGNEHGESENTILEGHTDQDSRQLLQCSQSSLK